MGPDSDLMDEGITPGRVQSLVAACANIFISKAPFLHGLPVDAFPTRPRPQYLALAMACIGSVMLGEPERVSTTLWWCSSRLLIGHLEVDNREARKIDLLKAVGHGILSPLKHFE